VPYAEYLSAITSHGMKNVPITNVFVFISGRSIKFGETVFGTLGIFLSIVYHFAHSTWTYGLLQTI